jgi:peptidoglycan/xylan/chitin deacetylase (PgdA/CDA1 family)
VLPYFAGAAALVFAGYHTMSPQSQLYGGTFVRESPPSRRLALTFDDGPSDPSTLRLLEVLERHQVRSTFFMIGRHVSRLPGIAKAVAEAGHEVGNHTHTHPLLTVHFRNRASTEIERCRHVLQETVGPHSALFRPPYGGRRPAVLRAVRAHGLRTVMWSVAGKDWQTQSAAIIEANVCQAVRGGDVILLHDGTPAEGGMDRLGTAEAVNRLIPRLKNEGYVFAPVSEMLPHQGKSSHTGKSSIRK